MTCPVNGVGVRTVTDRTQRRGGVSTSALGVLLAVLLPVLVESGITLPSRVECTGKLSGRVIAAATGAPLVGVSFCGEWR